MMQGVKEDWWMVPEPPTPPPPPPPPLWWRPIGVYCITEDVGNPPPPPPPPPPPGPAIDEYTKINIYFDSSGSMNQVHPVLVDMRNSTLKTKLLPFFKNDSALYDASVKVYSFDSERFLLALTDNLNTTGRTINMVFQNEAGRQSTFFNIERGYHDSNCTFRATDGRLSGYNDDIKTFNTRLNNHIKPYNGIMFHLPLCQGFRDLLVAMYTGIGNYGGSNGFSTRIGMNVKYDLDAYGDKTYYANKIVESLTDIGFNIP